MVRSTKDAKSSKEMPSRIHWDLRAETPMRCRSEVERCTIAVTSRFCWFHVSAKSVIHGQVSQGEEARWGDLNGYHVAERGRHLEVDVQSPGMGVDDSEVFALMLASEGPQPASAHVAFGQVLGEQLACHALYGEASDRVDPLSDPMRRRRIC